MLSNTLVTNEVKDATGTEVEFGRVSTGPGRTAEFANSSESPQLPHRLKISHLESGTGNKLRRRSVVRFDRSVVGIDGSPSVCSAYAVLDIPVGNISDTGEFEQVLANLNSFLSTTGAGTTVLFNGTGTGSQVLMTGQI